MGAVHPEAVGLILQFETGGRAQYDRAASRPHWPGHSSGLTLGIGWDCGYHTAADLDRQWSMLPVKSRGALRQACGLAATEPCRTKKVARIEGLVTSLSWITVPWEAAETVFQRHTLPSTVAQTAGAFPGLDRLPPLCRGALISLVYNRGPGMGAPDDDRRREMREIRDALAAAKPEWVPGLLRSMKRLWPKSPPPWGLLGRREEEAALFERGLAG